MQAEIKDGKLIITLELDKTGHRSKSGKSTIHATTSGSKATTVNVDGKPLVVSVNAYTLR